MRPPITPQHKPAPWSGGACWCAASVGLQGSVPHNVAFHFPPTTSYLTDMVIVRADGFVDPCIPSLAHKPPSGPDWVHEVKHDGYRLIVRRDGETVRLFTRRGYDWTERQCRLVSCLILDRPNVPSHNSKVDPIRPPNLSHALGSVG
jgi:hypothetical protein